MFNSKCVESMNVGKITVEENGKSATFLNKKREEFLKIRIDDCVIKSGKRADWLVEKIPENKAVIIELKGKKVKHALEQIEATVIFLKDRKYKKKIAGLIVYRSCPDINTIMQIAKDKFLKKYAMRIHSVSKNEEYIFDKLFTSTPLAKQ